MLLSHHSLLYVSAAEAAEIATPESDFLVTPGDGHNQTDDHCAENHCNTREKVKIKPLMVLFELGIVDIVSPPVFRRVFSKIALHIVYVPPSAVACTPTETTASYTQKTQSRCSDDSLFSTCDYQQ